MKIFELINEILDLIKYVQIKLSMYDSSFEFMVEMDKQFNAKAKLLLTYLKKNKLDTYHELLKDYLPINNNAIEFSEVFYSLKDEILEFEKFNQPILRINIINELALQMQEKYVRNDIDNIFSALNIKHGDEFYTVNSKRVYVQNILKETCMLDIIKLAKLESLIKENVDIIESISSLSNYFINEQIDKCNIKLLNKDFDGAITNARSLIEEILLIIEEKIGGNREEYDGNILKLYKRVSKLLNLEPDDHKVENSLNQVTRGFISIVHGLSSLSNSSGDRHAQTYKPDERHSILVVNSALILTRFLVETYRFQYEHNENLI